jgi:hypothetical protein
VRCAQQPAQSVHSSHPTVLQYERARVCGCVCTCVHQVLRVLPKGLRTAAAGTPEALTARPPPPSPNPLDAAALEAHLAVDELRSPRPRAPGYFPSGASVSLEPFPRHELVSQGPETSREAASLEDRGPQPLENRLSVCLSVCLGFKAWARVWFTTSPKKTPRSGNPKSNDPPHSPENPEHSIPFPRHKRVKTL